MFCPNCGAKNGEEQNYCRFCGLNLQASARSLMDQIVHGDKSDALKKLKAVKRTADIASAVLIAALVIGLVADIFFMVDFSKGLLIFIIGLFVLIQIIQGSVGFFQRHDESRSAAQKFASKRPENFETRGSAKLLEEMPIEPVASVTESTTRLLPTEKKLNNEEQN